MKTTALLILFTIFSICNLQSQTNLDLFTINIIKVNKSLEEKRKLDIDNFMKYGYQKKPELRNDEFIKIPVYTIYIHSKYINDNRTKDSLFIYLNPQSLCIENIFFYKKNRLIAVAYSKYINASDQPISLGIGNMRNVKLADIVMKEKPDILFSLSQNDNIFIFLKDKLLVCYLFDKKQDSYVRLTPKELFENIDDSEFYFMTNLDKPIPLVYSK